MPDNSDGETPHAAPVEHNAADGATSVPAPAPMPPLPLTMDETVSDGAHAPPPTADDAAPDAPPSDAAAEADGGDPVAPAAPAPVSAPVMAATDTGAAPPPAGDGGGEGKDSDKEATDWWAEIRGLLWLILAVLGFHSFVAKPFYIPSESMMPTLLVGDRLVVTKYPYGYSYVSPTFHVLPFIHGRLFGRMPQRGDIVILKPPQADDDYIKRVIGLPGDRIEVADGVVYINGKPVKRGPAHMVTIPDYGGTPLLEGGVSCSPDTYGPESRVVDAKGLIGCQVPVIRETLPNGVSYDTIKLGFHAADNYGPVDVPAGHVFLMGDNRDNSADSRFPTSAGGLGGPVPWENLGGRAEFITLSFDGSATWNPFSWFGAVRGARTGVSLHPEKDAGAKP